eukprot:1175211-Alexandrium_andersonii.AAC.1
MRGVVGDLSCCSEKAKHHNTLWSGWRMAFTGSALHCPANSCESRGVLQYGSAHSTTQAQ